MWFIELEGSTLELVERNESGERVLTVYGEGRIGGFYHNRIMKR